ncbi:MAG: isocitrate/isopropylmalate family dehydrogenase [Myxococcota bacterium]|nr:isocitrate/isopropylmalate family dehydrogenase [Myxococcota bacterium]
MLLRHSLGSDDAARGSERAVSEAIDAGVIPADLGGKSSTNECGTAVVDRLR